MNYYKVQSTYFLIFIVISFMAFAAVPAMKSTFSGASDSFVKARMNHIQGEMFFVNQGRGSFSATCYDGVIASIIEDLIQEYGKKVVCRTNKPYDSKMFIYVELRSGEFYCVDSEGVTCAHISEPGTQFQCKDF
ncbi:MAG: hypothetical protein ACJA2Z_000458 [Candidatus Paceibacteria bacterium]|jgi:hypothetical protein